VVRWCGGVVVWWCCGAVVLWCCGAVVSSPPHHKHNALNASSKPANAFRPDSQETDKVKKHVMKAKARWW